MSYNPQLEDFCEILKGYSLSGLKYFQSLHEINQRRIQQKIGPIEDKEQEIGRKFNLAKYRNQAEFHFIPMPRSTDDSAVWFFVPRFHFLAEEMFRCAFCLIAWIERNDGQTISFRLEPADGDEHAHCYNHVQLSLNVRSPELKTTMPEWIPQSYPAFPLGLSTPLQFFAAATVAVHGYSRKKTSDYIGRAIMTDASGLIGVSRAQRVFAEIRRMFDSEPFR